MRIFKSREEPCKKYLDILMNLILVKTPESGKNQFEDTIILSLSPTPFKDQF